jgi:magnesium-transporting ATPase (P-type)
LISGHLDVDQASLTGESEPVKKQAITSEDKVEEENQLFRASLIIDGEAVMRTSAVGDKTRYGQTMKEILSADDRLSPLQEKLKVLGGQISTFGYIGASFIFVAFMLNHIFLQGGGLEAYFTGYETGEIVKHIVTAAILAIIVIVVAVPEGLPMMIAMVLAINMKKLLHVKVLVRKLLGIETAGSLTVLFSDKTGTLTQGKLSVEEFIIGNNQRYQKLDAIPDKIQQMMAFALRNNTSAMIDTSDPNDPKMVGADRTEQAMLRFVTPLLEQKAPLKIVETIAFNSSRKFSATQVEGEHNLTLVKGAAEVILNNCSHYLDADGNRVELTDKSVLYEEMHQLSERAMRLLAVAIIEEPITEEKNLPQAMTLVGIF